MLSSWGPPSEEHAELYRRNSSFGDGESWWNTMAALRVVRENAQPPMRRNDVSWSQHERNRRTADRLPGPERSGGQRLFAALPAWGKHSARRPAPGPRAEPLLHARRVESW